MAAHAIHNTHTLSHMLYTTHTHKPTQSNAIHNTHTLSHMLYTTHTHTQTHSVECNTQHTHSQSHVIHNTHTQSHAPCYIIAYATHTAHTQFGQFTIIQRQITRKWYNIELYLQWQTNRKSYMIYRTAHFQWPWTTLSPVSMSRHSLTLNISETVGDTDTVAMKYW